ncbi:MULTISPECIES: RNA polymerase sigma factor [unclassified Streptomyces]|uniref:RNA polymerase sigma factor n=1 Tax=unclassified Streptomyces TaxID=2593676 RepID=UPI0004BDFCFC|nr:MULTISPECIES: sigma-70 family RNA polymerase sigma factor [unclassified Streptomyces]
MSMGRPAGNPHGQERGDAHFAREWAAAQPQLLAYARWATGSREEAEDLVQAVAVRAWRGFAHFRGDAAFLTWTMAIARREAARAGARRQRLRSREAPLPLDPPWAAEPQTPGSAVGRAEGGRLAEAARRAHTRGEINATELAVLLARLHRPDSTWAQLGEELGLPASRCAVAHCRGVAKFRVVLFLHHPELLGTPEELSEAAQRAARRTRSEPLTPDEADTFRRMVLDRSPGHRPRNWAALLRGGCAKVAEELSRDR